MMPFKQTLDVAMVSLIGARQEQQDNALSVCRCADGALLLALADGMGGLAGGAIASAIAVETVGQLFVDDPYGLIAVGDVAGWLRQAVRSADARIREWQMQHGVRCGTTLALAVVRQGELFTAHVGDSRITLVREGAIALRSQDHSVIAEQVMAGYLTAEQAFNHPQSNLLTRALGGRSTTPPLPDIMQCYMMPGDWLCLSSDGVWGANIGDEAARTLALQPDPLSAAPHLTARAVALGGERADNATLLVAGTHRLRPLNRPGLWREETNYHPARPLAKLPGWLRRVACL